MKAVRALTATAGLTAALLTSGPAHASTSGSISLPCVAPITRYSVLLSAVDSYTLPNGVCAWSVKVNGGGSFSLQLTNTTSADLDVVLYDRNGNSWQVTGGPLGFCGSFGGPIPAQAVLAVVTFSPGCATNADVKFNFST